MRRQAPLPLFDSAVRCAVALFDVMCVVTAWLDRLDARLLDRQPAAIGKGRTNAEANAEAAPRPIGEVLRAAVASPAKSLCVWTRVPWKLGPAYKLVQLFGLTMT